MQVSMGLFNQNKKRVNNSNGILPLSFFAIGDKGEIIQLRGDDKTTRFLENIGCVKGAEIKVVSQQAGNLIIRVKGARVGISKSMAMKIIMNK